MTQMWIEAGSTVRAAMAGWPQTVRLLMIIVVVTTCLVIATA